MKTNTTKLRTMIGRASVAADANSDGSNGLHNPAISYLFFLRAG